MKVVLWFVLALFMFTLVFVNIETTTITEHSNERWGATLDQEEEPEYTPAQYYVQIFKSYFATFGYFSTQVNTYLGGGSCIQEEDGGCYVLTSYHICDDGPGDLPIGTRVSFRAATLNGNIYMGADIVDMDVGSDLCLLFFNGDFEGHVQSIMFTEDVEQFAELFNYSSPGGLFQGGVRWSLFPEVGRWAGWCNSPCVHPISDINNFIIHTIPTNPGQSGSAITIGNSLFAVQSATNQRFDNYGIATSPETIYLFLERNNIELERVVLE